MVVVVGPVRYSPPDGLSEDANPVSGSGSVVWMGLEYALGKVVVEVVVGCGCREVSESL